MVQISGTSSVVNCLNGEVSTEKLNILEEIGNMGVIRESALLQPDEKDGLNAAQDGRLR